MTAKPKEKTPELKASLSGTAAILADKLYKDALAGRIDLWGEDQRWAETFRALCAWFKIEKGIDGDEEEGATIRGYAATLGTGKRASGGKRAAAPKPPDAAADDDSERSADGPPVAPGIAKLIQEAAASASRGNGGNLQGDSMGTRGADAPVFIASGGHPTIRVGNGRPDTLEADGDESL